MWSIVAATSIAVGSAAARHREAPELDVVALTGFLSVVMLLICFTQEQSAPGFALGCAVAGAVAAVYGVLQGAWPLSIAEAVWVVAALRRWREWKRNPRRRREGRSAARISRAVESSAAHDWRTEDRLIRLFGIK
jgi:hypothetical protein